MRTPISRSRPIVEGQDLRKAFNRKHPDAGCRSQNDGIAKNERESFRRSVEEDKEMRGPRKWRRGP